jgi:hypothetical protein
MIAHDKTRGLFLDGYGSRKREQPTLIPSAQIEGEFGGRSATRRRQQPEGQAASRRLGLSPICNNALQILAGRHRLALACTQFAVTI